jgi:excisionase family DNA binding protein
VAEVCERVPDSDIDDLFEFILDLIDEAYVVSTPRLRGIRVIAVGTYNAALKGALNDTPLHQIAVKRAAEGMEKMTVQRAYSVDEVARLLGVSPRLVRSEIAKGNIRAIRIGRRVLVSRVSNDSYKPARGSNEGRAISRLPRERSRCTSEAREEGWRYLGAKARWVTQGKQAGASSDMSSPAPSATGPNSGTSRAPEGLPCENGSVPKPFMTVLRDELWSQRTRSCA